MPKFVDNSYILKDVKLLEKDITEYHQKNLLKVYNELKQLFLDRELDNYENINKLVDVLKNNLQNYEKIKDEVLDIFNLDNVDANSINDLNRELEVKWQNYRKLVDSKQFFIRESPEEVNSIEELLDKCNKKGQEDKELIHNYVKDNYGILNTNNEHIKELYDNLLVDDYMDTRMRPFYRNYQAFVIEKMSHKYEKLYKNFAGIFFKVVNRTMDNKKLETMISMIRKVETGKMTQHNASVIVGKELGKQYINHVK
jgi:hypothetical protein